MTPVDRAKLRSLLFHALATSEPGQLSAGDLNLVVFLADMIHLGATGETISRETYVRGRFGPVAAHLSAVRAALLAEGVIREKVVTTDGETRIAIRLSERPMSAGSIQPLAAIELSSLGFAMEHLYGVGGHGLIADIAAAYDLESIEIGTVIDLRAMFEKRSAAAA